MRESVNDFTNLFSLVDAVNAAQPEPYRSQVSALMNVEEWMRVLAGERIAGNWDSYGYSRGKTCMPTSRTMARGSCCRGTLILYSARGRGCGDGFLVRGAMSR